LYKKINISFTSSNCL